MGKPLFSSPRPVVDHVLGEDQVTEAAVATARPAESRTNAELVPLFPFRLFQLACGTTPASVAAAKVPALGELGYSFAPKLSPILSGLATESNWSARSAFLE